MKIHRLKLYRLALCVVLLDSVMTNYSTLQFLQTLNWTKRISYYISIYFTDCVRVP